MKKRSLILAIRFAFETLYHNLGFSIFDKEDKVNEPEIVNTQGMFYEKDNEPLIVNVQRMFHEKEKKEMIVPDSEIIRDLRTSRVLKKDTDLKDMDY